MKTRFHKHYTREEARQLLPQIANWLIQLADLRDRSARFDRRLETLLEGGADVGGETVNGWLRVTVSYRDTLREFEQRQLQLKDLDRGLVDFPAILRGREVFLCWEQGEEDIEYWHELDGGFAGREPLTNAGGG